MISPGTRLGPYEIAAPLGAGGMGEVYRALDSRLDRTVAIKILPGHLSADARFRERFEREARAISALSHPHICALFDIGSQDGTDYIVMEYLEGESLAERLERGPLPIDQVIRYGTEIAEALERAHRAGIVHRDLKPGNVILTKSGAKLLDFGLAKFSQPSLHDSDPHAATAAMARSRQKPLTEEGSILGTFQYMAPEQIEGRDADERTDIFALGALLYEMATGKRAFEAKSRASLIASILDREPPPISTVQPLTPLAFERVVRMCLAKDPDERWQSAHDVAAELKWIGATSSESIGPGAKKTRRRQLTRAAASTMAGLLIGAAATWLAVRETPSPQRVARYAINVQTPVSLGFGAFAISPDGSRVVYRGQTAGTMMLFMRDAASLAIRPLAGTERAHSPAFSPDGRWVAFMDDRSLKKVPVDGGSPVKLADTRDSGLGVRWSGDSIFYSPGFSDGIWSVSADGGEPRLIAGVDEKERRAVVWPEVLPGGKTMLATVWSAGSWDDAKIVAFSLEDGSSKVVVNGGTHATYSPSGHLVYGRGASLMAVPFDPQTLEVRASPVEVVNGVGMDSEDGDLQYRISGRGDLLYAPGEVHVEKRSLVWVSREGRETPVVSTQRPYDAPVVSPDGRTIAVVLEGATYDVWLLDPERDLMTRISFGGDDNDPLFTRDGRHVIWRSSRSGAINFYRAPVDGSGVEERLTTSPRHQYIGAVSPDNRHLAFSELVAPGNRDVMLLALDTKKVTPLISSRFDEAASGFSPDGRWMLYWSNESGRTELYVRPFPGPGGKWQISTGGGSSAEWSADGREIFYRDGGKMYAVPIETAPQLRPGTPRLLFDHSYGRDVQLAPDGRFIFAKPGQPWTTSQFTIVVNWIEELKRRVPVK